MSSPGPHDNPYRPPRAPVVDVRDAAQTNVRPRLVNIAVGLIVISMVTGFVNTALQMKQSVTTRQFGSFLAAAILSTLIAGLITYKIWQGRTSARILLLVLVVIGLAISIPQIPVMFQMSVAFASVFILRSVLLLAALAILFLTTAKHWFATRSRPFD
jgi:hypothetical protein